MQSPSSPPLGSGPTICDSGTGAVPLESTQGEGVQIQQQRFSPEDVNVDAWSKRFIKYAVALLLPEKVVSSWEFCVSSGLVAFFNDKMD
jgi:hypothetical protein